MHGAATCNIYPLPILAKLNPLLRIGRVARLVEHWTDDVEIAGSSPLYAAIFLPTMLACKQTQHVRLYSWRSTIRMTAA